MKLKRASVSDSKINPRKKRGTVKGSLTIEAAMTIPLFLFAVLCLIYLLEVQSIQFSVAAAAQNAGKKAAEKIPVVSILNPIQLKADMVNAIGAERIERSVIEGGVSGIRCLTSYYDTFDETVHIKIGYRIRLPFPGYLRTGPKIQEEFQIKAWTGYQHSGMEDGDDCIVYITDMGTVYHTDYHCSALKVTIKFIPSSELSGLRNEDGGRYYRCEKCVHGVAMAGVYVTNYGKYHNSLNCSGLKRSIRAVKISEVRGRRECNRCGS